MVKEVRWTKRSLDDFHKVITYLKKNWTQKEVDKFIESTEEIVAIISVNAHSFRVTDFNLHEALITKHNLLIYKVYEGHVIIVAIWDTRKNPNKRKLK